MHSLEKKMFFLPNRLHARQNRLFVSFNIAVIPVDMDVNAAYIQLPLQKMTKPASLYVKEIVSGWSEAGIRRGKIPTRSKRVHQKIFCIPGQAEILIDIQAFQHKWRHESRKNHGIYFFLKSNNAIEFTEERPPFLVVDTI